MVESVRGLWRHYDRLLVCRVLYGLLVRGIHVPPALSKPQGEGGQSRDRGGAKVYQGDPKEGWLVVRLVGLLLYVRHMVWCRGFSPIGRAGGVGQPEARVLLSAEHAE